MTGLAPLAFPRLLSVSTLERPCLQADPIAFQGFKPWGATRLQEHPRAFSDVGLPDSQSPPEPKGGQIGTRRLLQHFYSGEIALRVRLPEYVEGGVKMSLVMLKALL